jgi:hypothetical protein
LREALVPQLQANGTIQMVRVTVTTATYRLAPTCVRFYQRLFKRAHLNIKRGMQ